MDTPGFASPIHTYRNNLCKMRESNDQDGSEATNLRSLGVVDLDLSVSPDVFGLRAFDESLPITRMLPGSSRCELRLLLPDSMIGKEGFHDVVVENLTASSTWRSQHVSPSDTSHRHSTTPTLAEGRVPSYERTGYGDGTSAKTSLSASRMGIPTCPTGLLPCV